MTSIEDLVEVTLVYDPALGSPPEMEQYGGRHVAIPAATLPPPARGRFLGLSGYSRQTNGAWEWVLQGGVDPVDQFVDSLTGRPGWLVDASRATVKLMIQRLFSAGIPRSTIVNQIPTFYQAIAAEVRAEIQAAQPVAAHPEGETR